MWTIGTGVPSYATFSTRHSCFPVQRVSDNVFVWKTPDGVNSADYVGCRLNDSVGYRGATRVGKKSRSSDCRRRLYRSWGLMRFHPKRRASIDQAPGPIIARATPRAPSNTQIRRLSVCERMFRNSTSAARLPTTGVHRPASKRIPAAPANAANMAAWTECPASNRTIA